MDPEDGKRLAFHSERKMSVPEMVKNSVLSWLRIGLAVREKVVQKSHLPVGSGGIDVWG